MIKILIAGEDRESSDFLRDAIRPLDLEIHLLSLELLQINTLQEVDFDLLILNLTDIIPENQDRLSEILKNLDIIEIPVISFINQSYSQLRSQLLHSGILQVLELPYTHAEARSIIEKILVNPDKNKIPNHFSQAPKDPKSNVDLLLELTNQLSQSDSNLDDSVELVINYFSQSYHFNHIFFFEIINPAEAILKKYISPVWLEMNVKINFSKLFGTSVKKNDLHIFENLDPQDENQIYFKSIFSISAKSIIICPILLSRALKFFILFIQEAEYTFTQNEKDLIKSVKQLFELRFHKEPILTQYNEEKKSQVSEYSSKFFQSIIDQLNFGLIIFNKEMHIKYINKEGKRLLNLDATPQNYKKIEDVLGEQNTQSIVTAMNLASSAYQRPEIEIVTSDSQRVLIGFTLTEFSDPLQEDGFILSLKDITYTKELQEEIIRMDRLASLGVMASGIAHEIRNPLAGIKAIAQTFEDELVKSDPKNEYVQRIIKQVNRLDDLLKSLFSYAKPQKPNRQFYHVTEIMQDVLPLLKQKIHTQKIKLDQSYDKELPRIFVDNSQIQQVIFNLILNSIEAIETDGEISVLITEVDPSDDFYQRKPFYKKIIEKRYLVIKITDNGSGITLENLQQIFNPFFTTKNFGTGLGLSIVYQIVQENNGIIYYESEEGQGTQCFLFLPAFDPSKKIET
jgi:nitrogen-specific signal transduction histidine kinase